VVCFLNDGHGHFSNFTKEAGTATRYGSITLALADFDGDGVLDLYVVNNRRTISATGAGGRADG
jgi:hypothetical protein